jgi:hypothetical protein
MLSEFVPCLVRPHSRLGSEKKDHLVGHSDEDELGCCRTNAVTVNAPRIDVKFGTSKLLLGGKPREFIPVEPAADERHGVIENLGKLIAAVPPRVEVVSGACKFSGFDVGNLNRICVDVVARERMGRNVAMNDFLDSFLAEATPIEDKPNVTLRG